MFKAIVVAVDGSKSSLRAVDMAAEMARLADDVRIMILTVYKHVSTLESTHSLVKGRDEIGDAESVHRQYAKETAAAGAERARDKGARSVKSYVRRGPPAKTIVKFAKEKGADLVILGRGDSEFSRFLLGSVSHKVCAIAECNCLTVV